MARAPRFPIAPGLALLLAALLLGARAPAAEAPPALGAIEVLDAAADFSFAVMSDHKGESPLSSPGFAKMTRWIEESGDAFVIGLGDHLKRGWENSFIPFLKQDPWWRDHFYPNVADGENEYYGLGQWHWGAGAPTLDLVALGSRPGVVVRDNRCEYYARIRVGQWTVHLIQLHYSDNPPDDAVAFNEDTRRYLADTLDAIAKGPRDIIIAAAHSRTGLWTDQLSEDQRRIVMDKADLVLSATTHRFERGTVSGYEDRGALCINTGSVTYPGGDRPMGYVQVHVLGRPRWLVVQYIDLSRDRREVQRPGFAFIKEIGGGVFDAALRAERPGEAPDSVLGVCPREYSRQEMTAVLQRLIAQATGADEFARAAGAGLPAGSVTRRQLRAAAPWRVEISVLTLSADQAQAEFGEQALLRGRNQIKVAMTANRASALIGRFGLGPDKILRTRHTPFALLEAWFSEGAASE